MILPVWKQLTHISPSTFLQWKNVCQFKVYLTKLSGLEYMPSVQGLAAAIGSAFDIFVKDYIAKKLKLESPVLDLNRALKKSVDKAHHKEAIPEAKELATIYLKELQLADQFLDRSKGIYLEQELFLVRAGIPILGKIDLIENETPVDWKTRGFTSTKGAYATKGWNSRIKYSLKTKQHIVEINYLDPNVPLEERHENWAIQLLFYNWLLGNYNPLPFKIMEICKHGHYIEFVTHEGIISQEFAKKIDIELVKMWEAITERLYHCEIEEPIPSGMVCEMYGMLCQAAIKCKFYENTLKQVERRSDYV